MLFVGASAFFLIKLLAYAAWCWLGLRPLATPPPDHPARRAFALGLMRVALGFGLGWLLVLALTIIAPAQNRLGLSFPALIVSSGDSSTGGISSRPHMARSSRIG